MIEKKITVTVGSEELEFKVGTGDYTRYQNEMTPNEKVTPSVNFLRRTLADKAQRPALDALCERGLALELAGTVVQEFRGDIEIAVKN